CSTLAQVLNPSICVGCSHIPAAQAAGVIRDAASKAALRYFPIIPVVCPSIGFAYRMPTIAFHSLTKVAWVLRKASQSSGTSSLNDDIGTAPAGAATSVRTE